MDLRKWFLLNDPPESSALTYAINHIPCSDFRSPSVMELFASGYRTGFRLTDGRGQPTESLHLMASLMNVELCQLNKLLPEERAGFKFDGPELVNVLSTKWYLRGVTKRVKAAQTTMGYGSRDWIWNFLSGLDGAGVTYRDPDGRKRKRVCYIAGCPPDWMMTGVVYEGLWRFTYEYRGEMGAYNYVSVQADGYGVLDADPTLRFPAGRSGGRHLDQELCASAAAAV